MTIWNFTEVQCHSTRGSPPQLSLLELNELIPMGTSNQVLIRTDPEPRSLLVVEALVLSIAHFSAARSPVIMTKKKKALRVTACLMSTQTCHLLNSGQAGKTAPKWAKKYFF